MREIVTKEDLRATKDELRSAIELQTLRLTVRLGSMIVGGFVAACALAALIRFT